MIGKLNVRGFSRGPSSEREKYKSAECSANVRQCAREMKMGNVLHVRQRQLRVRSMCKAIDSTRQMMKSGNDMDGTGGAMVEGHDVREKCNTDV